MPGGTDGYEKGVTGVTPCSWDYPVMLFRDTQLLLYERKGIDECAFIVIVRPIVW